MSSSFDPGRFFGKLDVVRREITVTSPRIAGGDTHYWMPMFGAGFQYNVSNAVTLSLQYLRVPGHSQ